MTHLSSFNDSTILSSFNFIIIQWLIYHHSMTQQFYHHSILSSFNDSFSCAVSFSLTTICNNNSWLSCYQNITTVSFLPTLCTTSSSTRNPLEDI
jgi:hypothetical protein